MRRFRFRDSDDDDDEDEAEDESVVAIGRAGIRGVDDPAAETVSGSRSEAT